MSVATPSGVHASRLVTGQLEGRPAQPPSSEIRERP